MRVKYVKKPCGTKILVKVKIRKVNFSDLTSKILCKIWRKKKNIYIYIYIYIKQWTNQKFLVFAFALILTISAANSFSKERLDTWLWPYKILWDFLNIFQFHKSFGNLWGKLFISNTFNLWGIKPLVKHCKLLQCYDLDCSRLTILWQLG